MIFPSFTRRTLFGAAALLSPLLRTGAAVTPDPLLAAIRITEAAGACRKPCRGPHPRLDLARFQVLLTA